MDPFPAENITFEESEIMVSIEVKVQLSQTD